MITAKHPACPTYSVLELRLRAVVSSARHGEGPCGSSGSYSSYQMAMLITVSILAVRYAKWCDLRGVRPNRCLSFRVVLNLG